MDEDSFIQAVQELHNKLETSTGERYCISVSKTNTKVVKKIGEFKHIYHVAIFDEYESKWDALSGDYQSAGDLYEWGEDFYDRAKDLYYQKNKPARYDHLRIPFISGDEVCIGRGRLTAIGSVKMIKS